MSQIADAMAYFAELIQNHFRYAGEGFNLNYESVAVEGFRKKGRGFVSIDISEMVEPYIKREDRYVKFLEKYVPLDKVSQDDWDEEEYKQLAKTLQTVVGDYNPQTEYVVQLAVDSAKLPPSVPWDFPNKLLISIVVLNRTIELKPTPLKKEQIKKRLKRMVQQGQRLLVADTSHPDFMGQNLEKWMRVAEELQNEGKYINLIIDSEDDLPYRHLPDDLKADIAFLG